MWMAPMCCPDQRRKRDAEVAKEEFARTIVLINSTNALECDFLNDPEYGVDAALWIGYTGSYGLNAVADILAGNVNPSGHLVDTYCYEQHHRSRSGGLLCKPVHQL